VGLVVESHPLCRVLTSGPFAGGAGPQRVLLEVVVRGLAHRPPDAPRAVIGVALKGEVCPFTIGEVGPVLADLARSTHELVCDLTDVTFLGAAAMRLFTELDHDLRSRGGRLWLQDPSPLARRIIEICHLERLLMTQLVEHEASGGTTAVTAEPILKIRNLDHGQTIEVTATVAAPWTPAGLVALQRKLVHLIGVRQPTELRLCAHTSNRSTIPPDSWREARDALASIGGTLTLLDGDAPA